MVLVEAGTGEIVVESCHRTGMRESPKWQKWPPLGTVRRPGTVSEKEGEVGDGSIVQWWCEHCVKTRVEALCVNVLNLCSCGRDIVEIVGPVYTKTYSYWLRAAENSFVFFFYSFYLEICIFVCRGPR